MSKRNQIPRPMIEWRMVIHRVAVLAAYAPDISPVIFPLPATRASSASRVLGSVAFPIVTCISRALEGVESTVIVGLRRSGLRRPRRFIPSLRTSATKVTLLLADWARHLAVVFRLGAIPQHVIGLATVVACLLPLRLRAILAHVTIFLTVEALGYLFVRTVLAQMPGLIATETLEAFTGSDSVIVVTGGDLNISVIRGFSRAARITRCVPKGFTGLNDPRLVSATGLSGPSIFRFASIVRASPRCGVVASSASVVRAPPRGRSRCLRWLDNRHSELV